MCGFRPKSSRGHRVRFLSPTVIVIHFWSASLTLLHCSSAHELRRRTRGKRRRHNKAAVVLRGCLQCSVPFPIPHAWLGLGSLPTANKQKSKLKILATQPAIAARAPSILRHTVLRRAGSTWLVHVWFSLVSVSGCGQPTDDSKHKSSISN